MSPSGKAPDFDSGIRRFESCHPSHVGRRQLRVVSAVFERAAKTPCPQPPSSFSPPKLTSMGAPKDCASHGPEMSQASGFRRFLDCAAWLLLFPTRPAWLARAGAPGERSEYDPLAQSVEQLPFKQWVRGSSPRRVTRLGVQKRCRPEKPRKFLGFLRIRGQKVKGFSIDAKAHFFALLYSNP